jgi:hypothetical protein
MSRSPAAESDRPITRADVLRAADVADLLEISKSTVEDWARRQLTPNRKRGRRRFFLGDRSMADCRRPDWHIRLVAIASVAVLALNDFVSARPQETLALPKPTDACECPTDPRVSAV